MLDQPVSGIGTHRWIRVKDMHEKANEGFCACEVIITRIKPRTAQFKKNAAELGGLFKIQPVGAPAFTAYGFEIMVGELP